MNWFFNRFWRILFVPGREWKHVHTETDYHRPIVYLGAVVLLNAIIKEIGVAMGRIMVSGTSTVATSAAWTAIGTAVLFAAMALAALVISAFAPLFGGKSSFLRGLQIIAYSSTPSVFSGVIEAATTSKAPTILTTIYTSILIFFSLSILMQCKTERRLAYFLVVVVVLLALYVVVPLGIVVVFV